MAGVCGNRTHQRQGRCRTTGFEVQESHQAQSTPVASTNPRNYIFETGLLSSPHNIGSSGFFQASAGIIFAVCRLETDPFVSDSASHFFPVQILQQGQDHFPGTTQQIPGFGDGHRLLLLQKFFDLPLPFSQPFGGYQ